MLDFQLMRDAFGKLVFTSSAGEIHHGVVPVRAFPIGAPDLGVALVSVDGHEVAWIEKLSGLPQNLRQLIEEELASREFMPVILCLERVSSFATPSTWHVQTDRGSASFVLRGEEDIRRVGQTTLLIADIHGIQFLVRDYTVLDRASRKMLDRFL